VLRTSTFDRTMFRRLKSQVSSLISIAMFSAILCQSISGADENAVQKEEEITLYDFNAPSVDQPRGLISLYADHKARRVGDIVTIIVLESSRASKSAATKTSKRSDSSGSLNDLFGLGNLPLKMGADAGSDYSGSGTTTRSGTMEAKISAFVKQLLPNGNLVLEGTRKVAVNDDVQEIMVSGIVRPQDVRADNSVLSIYLADAQIKYLGEGPIAQRPGILTRILQTPFHWVASLMRKIF
jgi:flagellar L-ring protein precursor FlgH